MAHDRGPEFWNCLVRELRALLQVQTRPGSPYRPTGQAPVDRERAKFRTLEGAFVREVIRAPPT